MSQIDAWAARHRIAPAALAELKGIFGIGVGFDQVKGASEAAVQSAVRTEAAQRGAYLWRNNVGALLDARGVPVRYGLANDSKALNAQLKSSDLIGWRPVLITQAHVGQVIGQFVSRECKRPGWRWRGDAHEEAQLAWLSLAARDGCDAMFCAGIGTVIDERGILGQNSAQRGIK